MKSFLATTAVLAATAQAALTEKQYSSLFSKFVEVHGKTYETKDMFRRYATFKSNVDYILDHNSQENNTFTLGVNQFADMTVEEFRKFIRADPDEDDPAAPLVDGSCLRCKKSSLMAECTANARNATAIDKYFEKPSMPKPLNGRRRNLVEEGFVTDVRNQGQCGSCYAFAAVGVIESAILVAYDNKVPGARDSLDLSEQQMVDCTMFAPYNNGGCRGGLPYEIFHYVHDTNVVSTENGYKYTASDANAKMCEENVEKAKKANEVSKLELDAYRYYSYFSVDEDLLTSRMLEGPVAVALDAGNRAFQFYRSGVLTNKDASCNPNHALLGVGVDTDPETGLEYYLIRNSWGSNWGDKGYVKVARGNPKVGANTVGIVGHPWTADLTFKKISY